MTDEAKKISPTEFFALVDAYGANERRWPMEKRAAAARFAKTPEGAGYLERAAPLDRLLAHSTTPAPSPALSARVLSTEAFSAAGRRALLRQRLRRWWTGAGLVGLGLAGGLTGAIAVTAILPGQPAAFGDGVAGSYQAGLGFGTGGSAETAFGTVPADNDMMIGDMMIGTTQ
jgi:hypothetical protein